MTQKLANRANALSGVKNGNGDTMAKNVRMSKRAMNSRFVRILAEALIEVMSVERSENSRLAFYLGEFDQRRHVKGGIKINVQGMGDFIAAFCRADKDNPLVVFPENVLASNVQKLGDPRSRVELSQSREMVDCVGRVHDAEDFGQVSFAEVLHYATAFSAFAAMSALMASMTSWRSEKGYRELVQTSPANSPLRVTWA